MKLNAKTLLAGIILAAFMAAAAAAQNYLKPRLYPKNDVPLNFSHELHLNKADCAKCHAAAAGSYSSADNLLPTENECKTCHGKETRQTPAAKPSKECAYCHKGYSPKSNEAPLRFDWKNPDINFSHAAHAKEKIDCVKCHSAGEKMDALPEMELCLSCHDDKTSTKYGCLFCHKTGADGTVKNAPQPLSGALNHNANWMKKHVSASKLNGGACAACHLESYCYDCHSSIVKPQKVHPGDYKLAHAAAAKKNPSNCASCHDFAGDCKKCHERLSVSENYSTSGDKSVHIHPPGWSSCALALNHHAYQAKRSLQTCAACHSESSCVKCHKPGGKCGSILSVHRHLSSYQLSNLKSKNPGMCKKCHGASK